MLTGIVLVIIVAGIAWAASQWRSKDPEHREGKAPPAFQYVGAAMAIFFLVALAFSIYLTVKNS